ncbi:protein ZGRF1 [Psammomys obesus]|uniref:protein ZGRF1 n=1 Tax=Psammomys obesus TaxID=48139 RepID=UPI00245344DF|nr:protein ZGRF1 [Psammomys obesus]
MEIQEFIVLYTHQKMKKSKVWQDGVLKIPHLGNKAILYDDKGACLESLFLKGLEVKPGDDLESERYLITVEEAKAAGSRAVKPGGPAEALESGPRIVTSSSRSLGCQPSGLKRKATGFQRPYKVPKTVTVTEHGELAASLGDMKPGSTFPPSFSSTLPLFSTVGQKDINHTSAGSENIATFRNRERNNRPFSLVSSSLRINSDTLGKEDNFCFPVSSEAQHLNSLLAKEPMRRNSSDSHCPGVSQNLRSKAQILALLKSSSSNKSSDLHCEITGRFPNGWPQVCLEGTSQPKEKYAETQSTGSLGCELQSENPTRTTSRWTMYLSSQRSPPCSARDENDTEDKPEAQKDVNIFNFSELLVPKKSELFETCTDNIELYSENKPVDNNCQYKNQEENPAPSFYEKSSLLVSCNSKENVDLLPECDIQNSSKVSFNQNDQMCMEGSPCTGESLEGANAALEAEYRPVSPSPEMEQKQSETECSVSNNSKVSDDIVDMAAESYADRVSMNTLHNPLQPFLEVSFNLSNFETSDTDEASQEDSKVSQDSESWEKEILLTDDLCVQKSCGDIGCQEITQKRLLLPPSASDEPKEMLPANKTLLSEFCDRTCVGFYAGLYEDADTGKTIEEQCGDTGSSLDSSLEWNEDAPGHSKEDANKSIQRNGINDGIVSPSNNSRGTDTSLHIPYPLNTVTNPAPENSDLFSEARNSPAIVSHALLECPHEHRPSQQPVEFQGHQVKGSATSGVMVRGHSLQLGCSQFPDSIECENFMTNSGVWTAELPSTCVQTDFLQVISPEQKIPALSPAPTFSFDTRNEDFVLEFSEESLKTRTFCGLKNVGFLESQNLQRSPFVGGTSVPFVDAGPAISGSCSFRIDDDARESSGVPMLSLCEESGLSFDLGPEDQGGTSFCEEWGQRTPGDVSLLHESSIQSKWLKYQNPSQSNSAALNRTGSQVTEGLFAEPVSGLHFSHARERQSNAVNESSVDPVHLQMMKGMLCQQQQDVSSQDWVSREKALSLHVEYSSQMEDIQTVLGSSASFNCRVRDPRDINGSELCFPSGQKIISAYLPQRQVHIPAVFQSPTHYKQIFTASIIEHLNILLFELAQRLYKALSKVDISFYTSSKGESLNSGKNNLPSCHHNQPAKLVMVKKEGPNKGRLFYTCDRPKGNQCKFFKWFEEVTLGQLPQDESQPNMVFNDVKSIGSYLRSQKVPVYEECQLLLRKGFDFQRKQYGKLKKFATINPEFYSETKSKIYLKLSRKESSSVYSKDDLWVISKTLDFKLDTFIACSAFFGPSSVNEVELLPLKGYFPSNWPTNITVHALLVCNASTELTTLKNIQDYVNPATLPLMPYLLAMSQSATVSSKNVSKRKFIPPAVANIKTKCELLDLGATLQLASELINIHSLNKDQATALIQIAQMIVSQEGDEDALEPLKHSLPITIIHGVFGAGKSYLLAVVILFFVQLFEKCDAETVGNARPWKILISSSTNVAVDRVLLGLLSLGFEKFVRVGSVRKIAKPILPYSLHAGSENESEQLKELHALMREELTPIERVYVRKSIEQHKLGTNRILLKQVRVVGITCAACPFPCMNGLKFPVVVLDESSQMTEPASLLPIARFECEKLILVGDPKQLPPTIQGSDAAHENGLEQTLFNRLCLMGHKPILLRTQYRCHPVISAIANDLFYEGSLVNGVSEKERSPVLEWLPTLCFYNVAGAEQVQSENSFQNVAEAAFTLKLIQSLIASGVAGSMIGVITLYKSQMYKIFHLLSAVDVGLPDVKAVQVSTVDAFQGAEKEIIILSCVRTRQVGFIDSEKRMNVALTRGRRHLLIVGSLSCLRKNRLWGRVIQHCEGREDGLQHASQCEPQLDHLLKDYFEKQAEEKQKKKEKEKSKDKSH